MQNIKRLLLRDVWSVVLLAFVLLQVSASDPPATAHETIAAVVSSGSSRRISTSPEPAWTPNAIVLSDSLLPTTSTCQSRTVNYITHILPQQCLKPSRATPAVQPSARGPSGLDKGAHASVDGLAEKSIEIENDEGALVSDDHEKKKFEESGRDRTDTGGGVSNNSKPSQTTGSKRTDDDEHESPLENDKFLSFEEWKKKNFAKLGHNGEKGRAVAQDGRKKQGNVKNALEMLGEGEEVPFDIKFGNQYPVEASEAVPGTEEPASANGVVEKSSSFPSSKDAGTTCKERFNYASLDCAATVLKTNPKCKSPASVLKENKDSYMLNECATENKFLIVELCDDILVDTIVLSNFEFFSSMFRTFRVSVSDRYPVKLDRWKSLGIFEARNSREIQAFPIENPLIWARYLRVEFLTHYGNEFYCPVSLLRVHGTTMMEEVKKEDEEARSEEELADTSIKQADESTNIQLSPPVYDQPSHQEPKQHSNPSATETSDFQEPSPKNTVQSVNMSMSSTAEASSKSVSQSSKSSVAEPQAASEATNSSGVSTSSAKQSQPSDKPDHFELEGVGDERKSQTEDKETSRKIVYGPELEPSPSEATENNIPDNTSGESPISTTSSKVKPLPASQETVRQSASSTQPPPANPTTQESFFKTVHKRLQMLESNSTLSLQYIEEQSSILRDAFTKVEKRQLEKTEKFLENLNETVMAELKNYRQQYDQLWQSTVIELENHREQYQREILAVSQRLTIMADELVFQKRMAVVQSTLLLICLGLVLFVRSGGMHLELPLMQQVLNKSHSMLRLQFDSPPGSPLSRETSPLRQHRADYHPHIQSPVQSPADGQTIDTVDQLTPTPSPVNSTTWRRGVQPTFEFLPPSPSDQQLTSQDEFYETVEKAPERESSASIAVEDEVCEASELRLADEPAAISSSNLPSTACAAPKTPTVLAANSRILSNFREIQSGPATPNGTREQQNPMEWAGDVEHNGHKHQDVDRVDKLSRPSRLREAVGLSSPSTPPASLSPSPSASRSASRSPSPRPLEGRKTP